MAEAGQDVGEVRRQLQVAAPHRLGEVPPLFLRGLLEGSSPPPRALRLPAEPRLGGKASRLAEEGERVADVPLLLALDLRLRLQIPDVHVRVRDEVEGARRHRAERHRLPKEFVLETLAVTLPQEDYEATFVRLVSWARYGELFAYDDDDEMVTL